MARSAPQGYQNVAFSYRYLDTDKTPLALVNEYFSGHRPNIRPGQWLWETYGKEGYSNPALYFTGRGFDDTYRILADEYYRELE